VAVSLLAVSVAWQDAVGAPPGTLTRRIAVDQFGYPQDLVKVAVISDPQQGFNSAESYTPGSTLEVRTSESNNVVSPERRSLEQWVAACPIG